MNTLIFIANLLVAQTSANATVVSVVGRVELTPQGGTATPLERFTAIPAGGSIQTFADSRASLRLPSGTLIRLAPETTVQIAGLTAGNPAAQRKESIRMSVGRLWAKVSRLFGDESSFEVTTNNAVAGVRGTAFFVEASGANDRFTVDHGTIVVGNGGQNLTLDGPGATGSFSGGLSEGTRLTPGQLRDLRHSVGGGAANLLTFTDPSRSRQTEYLRSTIVGPDDPADDLQPGGRRTDSFGGAATVYVRLIIQN